MRIEIVWNIDRSCRSCNAEGGGIDIDLHLADVARAGGHWADRAPDGSDCYYANCNCQMPGMLCPVELLDWPPVGSRVNNPQLDVDHIGDWLEYLHVVDEKLADAVKKLEAAIADGTIRIEENVSPAA